MVQQKNKKKRKISNGKTTEAINCISIGPNLCSIDQILPKFEKLSNSYGIQTAKYGKGDRNFYQRERNRVHAQRTRERKKHQITVLQRQIKFLRHQSLNLEMQYKNNEAVKALISMRQCSPRHIMCSAHESMKRMIDILLAAEIVQVEFEWIDEVFRQSGAIMALITHYSSVRDSSNDGINRVSSSNKTLTAQQRSKIRRERNRLHASRARGKRRLFLEAYLATVRILEVRNEMLMKRLEHDHYYYNSVFPNPKLISAVSSYQLDDSDIDLDDITKLWEMAQCTPLITSNCKSLIDSDSKYFLDVSSFPSIMFWSCNSESSEVNDAASVTKVTE